MTTAEIKTEIQKALNEIPEYALHDVLSFLQEVKDHTPDKEAIFRHLDQIIKEDRDLLKKLAQ